MVISALIVHTMWGVILLQSASPLYTTPLASLKHWPHGLVALAYLASSVAAGLSLVFRFQWSRLRRLYFCLPQQFLMMSGCGVAAYAVWVGQYPDGYVPTGHGNPHLFILSDQLWPIVGMAAHTASLIDEFHGSVAHDVR